MIIVQKILFLRNVSLFTGMPPRELSHLAGIAEEVIYSEGESIIVQDEHGDSMFLIVEGNVLIHRNERDLAELKAKDYFGEMSILDGEPRSASATATSDCLLLRIKQADFHEILSQRVQVAMTIIKTLTQRLREESPPSSANPDPS